MPISQDEPPRGTQRTVVLDASWTHIARFPDREEIRDALIQTFQATDGLIYYVTNLPWDAELFSQVAADMGRAHDARTTLVEGFGDRMLSQARQVLSQLQQHDQVLLALVPARDDRGSLQRLRSDFAARVSQVRAYPALPISSGPGPSRDEALAAVGLWLPTSVLIAGGPVSEQFLLARYLQESTGGSTAVVGVAGAEYRLPGLEMLRHSDGGRRSSAGDRRRVSAGRTGLVIVTYGPDDTVQLSGAGLPEAVESVLGRLNIKRRGKTPEQVVREIEAAFSSRGLPVPAVRYLA